MHRIAGMLHNDKRMKFLTIFLTSGCMLVLMAHIWIFNDELAATDDFGDQVPSSTMLSF